MKFYDRENEIRLLQESEKLSERAALASYGKHTN